MQYSVLGTDGNKYGPVDLPTLKQWVSEGRVYPTTQVTNHASNMTLTASQMPELGLAAANAYGAVAPPAAFSQYPRGATMGGMPVQTRNYLGIIIIRVLLGVGLSLISSFGGLIFTGYALYYGIRAYSSGRDSNGLACLLISALGFTFVVLYTIYKFSTGMFRY
ncbi:MAG: hypothetical protein JST12_12860 [Armatimonadetes bacterium]|nr:hypothetical protein [Armatimonadota bacterium]MBS1702549.1 hypothetical protein [Armatimonadota bacterium]MBS1725977.1 hypothetical protein [Armatimonadota bacterium]